MNRSSWQKQLAWVKRQTPLTARALSAFPKTPDTLVGVRFHIDLKMIPVIEALSERMNLLVFACHPDTTDGQGWEYLQHNSRTRLEPEWQPDLLEAELQNQPDAFLCDLGGEMITWAIESGAEIRGCMEGTTSGIKSVARSTPPSFPVLDWNGSPLKLEIHNEKMVGFSLWQTFTEVTRLSLHGRSVGVLGYGLVGRGIARTARALGGSVQIYEPDENRRTCAAYEGFRCPSREEVLGSQVVVSATGVPEAITEDDTGLFRDGAFLLNAGHSETEISSAIREHQDRKTVLQHVEEVSLSREKQIFLLARGRLLNLAAGFGDTINAFDVTSALLVDTLNTLVHEWSDLPRGLYTLDQR
jgi:adenosylhomocysteinase